MKDKLILITGGAGFIGTHLAQKLCQENRVRIFDNFSRDALSRTSLKENPNLEVIQGDVCNHEEVARVLADVTHVVHLAAIAGVDTVLKQPVRTMEVALFGTHNVLKEARSHAMCGG